MVPTSFEMNLFLFKFDQIAGFCNGHYGPLLSGKFKCCMLSPNIIFMPGYLFDILQTLKQWLSVHDFCYIS